MLLLKIKLNHNYLVQMITIQAAVGGLNLISIESKQIIEAINLYVLLFTLLTPSSFLLVDSLELLQLESGLANPVTEVDYSIFRYYIIKGWLQSV